MNWLSIERLLAAITAAGGTIPADITALVATRTAVENWNPPPSSTLEDIVARGELTATNADKILDAALIQPNRQPSDLKLIAETALTKRTRTLIRDTAADDIIASLQPIHAEAIDTMVKASQVIGTTTSAEEALEIDGGVKAWRDLATARATLDRIDTIVETLYTDFGTLGSRNPQLDIPRLRYIVNYANGIDAPLHALGEVLNNHRTRARGGRWHHAPALLHLNTPTQAREILDHHRQIAQEIADADYARTHGTLTAS
ncbi:hypothetical protein JTZ10_10970 [Gordonia rubripertincta]|uniref:DUF222 domain-containing protein n=1 Tax=Gordonia rubripertincta TaxID=36822 RepID=A0AAW4G4R4_GORRU|nr:hypothetical protein [Gordonia rubripertincta]MBM7278284.1 hypothetical protein [Gordonia rubripertincta]